MLWMNCSDITAYVKMNRNAVLCVQRALMQMGRKTYSNQETGVVQLRSTYTQYEIILELDYGEQKIFSRNKNSGTWGGEMEMRKGSPQGPIYAYSSPTHKLMVQRWVAQSSSPLPKANPMAFRNQHKFLKLFLRQ